MKLIAKYLETIAPSPTLALSAKAKELRAQGIDVLSLSVGEPDFDTPNHIKQAAIRAINEGKTKYTAVDGIPELKRAIQKKYESRMDLSLENIIVSSGAKQVLYNCFMATVEPNDEVIIPSPFWVSYPDMVKIARGKPVIVNCDNSTSFKLTPAKLESVITLKSKWLILNSPNNPTGMKYSRDELQAIIEVIKRYPQLHILSDDIYEDNCYDGETYSIIDIAPDFKDRIFVVNGVSKTYSMTGWRIGYGIGNKDLIKSMKIIQSQSTSNPCSISQYAAVEAISGDQNIVKKNIEIFQEKRDLALEQISKIKGISCIIPEGAFYLFLSCADLIGKKTESGLELKSDHDFCDYLLNEAKVAVVPGSAFGSPDHFRFSYAVSKETIIEAVHRIKTACEKLI